jgi:hypothetical protein
MFPFVPHKHWLCKKPYLRNRYLKVYYNLMLKKFLYLGNESIVPFNTDPLPSIDLTQSVVDSMELRPVGLGIGQGNPVQVAKSQNFKIGGHPMRLITPLPLPPLPDQLVPLLSSREITSLSPPWTSPCSFASRNISPPVVRRQDEVESRVSLSPDAGIETSSPKISGSNTIEHFSDIFMQFLIDRWTEGEKLKNNVNKTIENAGYTFFY